MKFEAISPSQRSSNHYAMKKRFPMAKSASSSFDYTYTLIVRSTSGQRINGTVSIRDLESTRRLAQNILRQEASASLIDVFLYSVNLSTSDPVETVCRKEVGEYDTQHYSNR